MFTPISRRDLMENQEGQPQSAPQVVPAETPLERATDIMWKRMLMILGAAFLFIIVSGVLGFCSI
jgi:hypothetical protein